jgi:hypothetical protein
MSTQGPPRTVLPDESSIVLEGLDRAQAAVDPRAAVSEVVADHPRSLTAWAALGALGRDAVERYAAFRVGYHRGLDTLRANGWRGSGYVRWADPSNRGFLRCLVGLGRAAHDIGECDEAERIAQFLTQLDPTGVPADE